MRAAHLSGERRVVTTLFADVVGSTALAEQMDAERWAAIMNHAFERLMPAIARYDGTLARLMGDGLLAFFGAPFAHEDDPSRAVRAALDLLDAAASYATTVQQEHGIKFAVRVGVSTGTAVLGDVGTDLVHEYTAMGDAVNVAARLQASAPPMGVLVAETTHRAIESAFDCTDRGLLRVKGRTEPVRAFEVRGPKARAEHGRAWAGRGLRAPLIGRDQEMAALTTCLDRLSAGVGGAASIIGEAGVGKSRLLGEVRQRVVERGFLWLEGHTLSFGQEISYWPFKEMLRRYVGISEVDSDAECWTKLERSLAPVLDTERDDLLPYLGTLLALEVPAELAERVKYLDGEAIRRQLFRAARRLLERLAQQRPLVLVIEDLHWIDHSSAELLEHLLPLAREIPLLLCGVSRPERHAAAQKLREVAIAQFSDRYTEVTLAQLSRLDSEALVSQLLLVDERFEEVGELILDKAEGNPFFVEEIVRSLIEQRAVVWDDGAGRWRATAHIRDLTIPDTVQGVIAWRLDRLESDTKEALRLASVVGRNFLYRILRALTEASDQLDRGLADLEALELIRERRRSPELEYMFKHALTQETTYQGMLLARRRALHARVGACIEALFADRLEEFFGLLAYHYARGEEWAKAQEYLFKAGDQARNLAADAEALAHYSQAVAAYERVFGDKWDPFQRAVLERKIGEALIRRGENEQGRQYLSQALQRLGAPLPTSQWGVRRAVAGQLLLHIGHRLLPRRAHAAEADASDESMEERWRIYELLGWIDYQTDRRSLLLDALLAINSAENAGSPDVIARACAGFGLACDLAHRSRLAEPYHRRALGLIERTRHPLTVGLTHHCVGFHEYFRGRWETALSHFQQAGAAYWDAGELRRWGASTAMGTWALRSMGRLGESLDRGRELVSVGRDGGDPQVWGWGLLMVGSLLRMAGAPDDAMAHLQRAAELLDAVPDHLRAGVARGEVGLCYLHQGDAQRGLAVLEQSAAQLAEHGVGGYFCGSVRNGLAEAYLQLAEQAQGSERAAALKRAQRACMSAVREAKLDREALPAAYRLQGTYQWLATREKAAIDLWKRSLGSAEELGARYELGLTYLEMGKRQDDSDRLEQAEAAFDRIHFHPDARQIRSELGDVD